ncbi:adenylate/guanylate cyclase domain-containing protein [Magnetospirillum gryphiswaldense]|uniref:Adenylate/guanylate cyclase catalytic domain protein n=1 Tax=Magnetospirillum gryphiswaldense TaxID=55518 RepID=A4TUL5_9PROT|nr:adenylate/guanylate cyclase domain-containing protein [Magnetospirillum gryphiswaldense]AVM75146.1 Adenylate cyclase 1 [Magnetospirillum gryphiswaldense MSR-1]AVM79049.1 Adenylate cyclase 1 [Magnetospirillum gryphiswaldense]CAM74322.1 adenylate/guanylate cyclase catalytic domain protein [Magnetospirillum gryphiswaldense MSR-1]
MGFLARRDVLLTVLLFLLALPAQHFEWFALLEDQANSFRHQMRIAYGDQKDLSISKDVVLVNVDEPFFKAYGSYPLRRTDIGAIISNIKELGAKVVAVDMLMDFPSSYNEDPTLAAALKDAGNTILVAQGQFEHGKFVKLNYPTKLLDEASVSGYTNISSNSALLTVLSRLKIHPDITKERHGWPFAVQAVAMYLGQQPKLENNVLSFGDLKVPLDHGNHLYIDFPPLPSGTRFLSQSAGISALEFLDISQLDEAEKEELGYWVKDKIVVVGDTSEVSHDWFDTPVGMVYGVEIIADTISSILKGAPLRAAGTPLAAAVTSVLMMLMILLAVAFSRPVFRAVGAVLILGGFVVAVTAVYVHAGLVLPLSYALAAGILSYVLIEYRAYMVERNQKKQISKTFGQYIPAELVKEMNESGQEVSVGGESREMTVLFSDVRGFTTISEGLSPQDLTTLMNAFLSPMTRVIQANRGTIDKYMGDAIMAFWGAPLRDENHAEHAVRAALAMGKTMDELSESFIARGWKPLKIGVGLNTGVMSVGNMGSDFRLAYTVMGDAVNLGSRLESLTKQYGIFTQISEYTLAQVPGLIAREVDLVKVKGKDQPVRTFEPLGFDGDVDQQTLDILARYTAALALYRAARFSEAKAEFQALSELEPNRMLYKIYIDRIAHYEAEPPPADWDGSYTAKEK